MVATSVTRLVEFTVSGMTCSMCAQSITRALESAQGVERSTVTLSTNQAKVEFDSSITSADALKETIEDVGYDVVEMHVADVPNTDNYGQSAPLNGGFAAMMDSPDRVDRMLEQQEEEVKV